MVKESIVTIFYENKKRYGYRRITQELHNNGLFVNHKTVQKLMRQLGLVCQVRARKKYNSYKGELGKIAPNLLERRFKADQPNRKWVTDVTEFKVNGQKLYLSPILDLFNGEVVSYSLSRHPNFKQITGYAGICISETAGQGRQPDSALRPGLAIPDETLPAAVKSKRHYTKHVSEGYLSRQCRCRKLLWIAQDRAVLSGKIYFH